MASPTHAPRVVFINRFFHPDHSATSQMLSDLAFALAARGWDVSVLTSGQIYDRPEARLPARDEIRGVHVRRVWTTRFGRRNLVGRAIDYLSFYLTAAAALPAMIGRGDIVVAKTDPPLMSVIAAPLAAFRGARLVNWLQDVFPEVAEAVAKPHAFTRPLFGMLRRLRDRSLKSARLNVTIGEVMASRLAARGVAGPKIRVIPNWADGALVHPVPRDGNPLRTAWGLDGKFVVGYSGNLGRAHESETMLRAIARLEQKGAAAPATAVTNGGRLDIAWLFIGGGAQLDVLRKEAEVLGLGSVMMQPYQPRERLAESLGVADVHLVTLRPELEGLIVPSKFYGIAAAGRGTIFIGDHDGEIARLLRENACGETVANGDDAALADFVEQLADAPQRVADMGRAARAAFDQAWSLDAAAAEWEDALRDVAADRTSS